MAGISKANLRKELTKGPFKGKSAQLLEIRIGMVMGIG